MADETSNPQSFWQSSLYELITAKADEYWQVYPTQLHYFEQLFLRYGTGYEWSGSILVHEREYKEKTGGWPEIDVPCTHSTRPTDPALHPSFQDIAVIPQSLFLRRISDDAFSYDERDSRETNQPVYPLCNSAKVLEMPFEVDVHHLAAAMTIFRHIWENQATVLRPENVEDQLAIVKTALHTGFEIIEKRGLQVVFAKSCREIGNSMPKLAELDPRHVEHANEQYKMMRELRNQLLALSPEEKERLRRELKLDLGSDQGEGKPQENSAGSAAGLWQERNRI